MLLAIHVTMISPLSPTDAFPANQATVYIVLRYLDRSDGYP